MVRPQVFEPLIPRQLGNPSARGCMAVVWLNSRARLALRRAAEVGARGHYRDIGRGLVGNVQMASTCSAAADRAGRKLRRGRACRCRSPMMRAAWNAPTARRRASTLRTKLVLPCVCLAVVAVAISEFSPSCSCACRLAMCPQMSRGMPLFEVALRSVGTRCRWWVRREASGLQNQCMTSGR